MPSEENVTSIGVLRSFLDGLVADAGLLLWQSKAVSWLHGGTRFSGAVGAVLAAAANHVSQEYGPTIAASGAIVAVAEHALSRVWPSAERGRRLRWYAEDLLLLAKRTAARADARRFLVPDLLQDRDLAKLLDDANAERDRLAQTWRLWEVSDTTNTLSRASGADGGAT